MSHACCTCSLSGVEPLNKPLIVICTYYMHIKGRPGIVWAGEEINVGAGGFAIYEACPVPTPRKGGYLRTCIWSKWFL